MMPILGAILGLIGAAAPELVKLYKDRQDKKHELELLKLQMEMQKAGFTQRLEEVQVTADVEVEKAVYKFAPVLKPELTGTWWFDLLTLLTYVYNTTVRPTISYLVMGVYIYMKYAQYKTVKAAGVDAYAAILQVWNETDTTFVFLVITFWLGGRQFLRSMGKIK